jgi:hypothetical protein
MCVLPADRHLDVASRAPIKRHVTPDNTRTRARLGGVVTYPGSPLARGKPERLGTLGAVTGLRKTRQRAFLHITDLPCQ